MSGDCFDPIERAPPETLKETILDGVNETLSRASETAFYGDRLPTTHVDDLADLREVPLTTKEQLRDQPVEATMVRPAEEVVEYHGSSGTTGQRYLMALTEADLRRTREALARTWYMHGIRPEHTVQMTVDFGLFTAGHLNQYAIQEIGASVVPSGVRDTDEQFELLERLDVDHLVAVSDYYLRMASMVEEGAHDLPDLDAVVGGGVPVPEQMHDYIDRTLDTTYYNQYGLAEINTGLAGECPAHDGLHLQADYAYPEVVDPETGVPLPDGEEGILVLTTLGRDAQVHVRYRTGDLTSITWEPCECGRTLPRIDPVQRREGGGIRVHGTDLDECYLKGVFVELETLVDPFKCQLRIDEGPDGDDRVEVRVVWRDEPAPADLQDRLVEEYDLPVDAVETFSDWENRSHKYEWIVDERGG